MKSKIAMFTFVLSSFVPAIASARVETCVEYIASGTSVFGYDRSSDGTVTMIEIMSNVQPYVATLSAAYYNAVAEAMGKKCE